MKPIYQSFDGTRWSNCFSACVASVLELALDDVPDFMWRGDSLNARWFEDFADWLRPRGMQPLMVSTLDGGRLPLLDTFYLVGGKSVRDIMHSCVGLNGEIVHDPYPGGAGIHTVTDFTVFVNTLQKVEVT